MLGGDLCAPGVSLECAGGRTGCNHLLRMPAVPFLCLLPAHTTRHYGPWLGPGRQGRRPEAAPVASFATCLPKLLRRSAQLRLSTGGPMQLPCLSHPLQPDVRAHACMKGSSFSSAVEDQSLRVRRWTALRAQHCRLAHSRARLLLAVPCTTAHKVLGRAAPLATAS